MNTSNAGDQDAIKAIVNTIGDIRKFNNVTLASFTFFLLEVFHTFPEEYEFVWKSDWSWGKVIYILSRYGTLFNQAAGIPFWLMIDPSFNYCKYFFRIDVWFTYLFASIVAYVTGVRTYALCTGQKGIKWAIVIMFIIQFCVVIGSFVLYEKSTKFTESPFTGVSCLFTITTSPRLAQILAYAAAALFEIGLWLVSTARALQFVRQGKSRLVAIVFRDSLAYVTLVTSSAVVTVFLWLFIPEEHSVLRSTLANISQVVGSVICSRMLLHLRSYYAQTTGSSSSPGGGGAGGHGGDNGLNGDVVLGKMSLTTIHFGGGGGRNMDLDLAALETGMDSSVSQSAAANMTYFDIEDGARPRRNWDELSSGRNGASTTNTTCTLQANSFSTGEASSATYVSESNNF